MLAAELLLVLLLSGEESSWQILLDCDMCLTQANIHVGICILLEAKLEVVEEVRNLLLGHFGLSSSGTSLRCNCDGLVQSF